MTMRDVLLYFVCKYKNYSDQLEAIANKEPVDPDLLSVYLNTFKGIDYVTCIDDDYPDYYKEEYNPPLVVFFVDKEHRVSLTNPDKALEYIKKFS